MPRHGSPPTASKLIASCRRIGEDSYAPVIGGQKLFFTHDQSYPKESDARMHAQRVINAVEEKVFEVIALNGFNAK